MGRGRSVIGKQIDRKLEQTFENPVYGNKLLEAQGMDPFRLVDAAPMDDGEEPLTPTGVVLTPFLSALHVEWAEPRTKDHVEKVIVEITPSDTNTPATHEVVKASGTTIPDLSYVQHSVRIKFVDMWDRESLWSTPVSEIPNEGADYRIDLEQARIKNNLAGLIPAMNTDLLAGENFAANTVRQVALSTPANPNLLPLIEVDFDAWPSGQVWPPPDSNSAGTPYITAAHGNGITSTIVDRAGIKWIQVTRSSTSTSASFVPFSRWARRGVIAGESYIASVYVQGNAGVRARLVVEHAQDSAGTGSGVAAFTNITTLSGADNGERLFIKFTASSTHTFIRLRVETNDVSTVTRWTKFQLEAAEDKTEPSAWTAGVMSAGVMNARMITAIDANIANAIFKEASIENAFIKEVTADKIKAGVIGAVSIDVAATLTILTGGKLVAGGTKLDSTGITIGTGTTPELTLTGSGLKAGSGTRMDSEGLKLHAQTSFNTKAYVGSYKVSSVGESSALMFYSNSDTATDGPYRGAILRADGEPITSTSRVGAVVIHATEAGTIDTRSGKVEVLATHSGVGRVNLYEDVNINRHLEVAGRITSSNRIAGYNFEPQIRIASTSIASGTSTRFIHNLGVHPSLILGYLFNAVGTSNPNGIVILPTPDGNMYMWDIDINDLWVWNGFSSSRNYVGRVYR